MYAQAKKPQETSPPTIRQKNQPASGCITETKPNPKSEFGFTDNRHVLDVQKSIQKKMDYHQRPIPINQQVKQFWPATGSPTNKYPYSSFQDTTKRATTIYMLYDSATQNEDVEYIGKTVQQGSARFQQHKRTKNLGPNIKSEKIREEQWTPFETATHEQYWIGEAGGTMTLTNRINALTEDKWDWFKDPTGHAINKDQEAGLTSRHF